MTLPRYPKYKDSGVEWLSEVPEHWKVDRFKWSVSSCRNGVWGDEPLQDANDIPCVRVADFDRERLRVDLTEPTIRNVTLQERSGRVLEPGNLLLEKAGGGELQPVGCVVLYDEPSPAVCSNFIARMSLADGMDASFWRYAHTAAYSVRLNIRSIKQTSGIQNLDQQQYLDELAPFPPISEQKAIARFLENETSKVDALISEQQRLVEVLTEKRQAVVSHAVTKGLNPGALMKASGVEWLGDVPAHWKVLPLKRIADVNTGVAKGKDHGTRATVRVPYLRVANVQDGYLDLAEIATIEIPVENLSRYALQPGDVLMNEGGDYDKLGRGCVWDGQIDPCITQNHVFAVRPRRVSSAWLSALTGSDFAQFYFMTRSKQSTNLASISSTNLMELPVILPPDDEQRAILEYIAGYAKRSDELLSGTQAAVDLLLQRRQALISSAVTGHIDVRKQLTAVAP